MAADTIVKIKAQDRAQDKNPRQIRTAGFLPITVYGKNVEAKSYQIDAHEFEMAYKGSEDATFELETSSGKIKTKVQNIQKNYSLNQILNIEFKAL